MKKLRLPIIAICLAFALSSFRSATKKPPVTLYYQENGWQSIVYDFLPCPAGGVTNCWDTINNLSEQLFYSHSVTDPVRTVFP